MNKLIALTACFLWFFNVVAQSKKLTLEECYAKARENYPLIKQRDLIGKTRDFTIENIAKGYLPQINVTGQATYQSDVTEFPKLVQGVLYPVLSKDQYRIGAELTQTIYDGGAIKYNKETQNANATIQEQTLEVNLYSIKNRINQLYFGVLLINKQLELLELKKNDIQNALERVEAAYNNGTAFKSNVDELQAELINADQNKIELQANKKGLLAMLAIFINEKTDDATELETPASPNLTPDINRPELKQFDSQKKLYDIQEKQLSLNHIPKVSAFAQGYYGRPTYDFISNDFGLYGIIGLRFNWPLSGFYTNKNDKKLMTINRNNIDIQKETFLFNTQLSLSQQNEEAIKYQQLLKHDDDIITLRTSIKSAANAQLDNGVITTHDFIVKINDENQARLNAALHEMQLLQVQYNYKNTAGN